MTGEFQELLGQVEMIAFYQKLVGNGVVERVADRDENKIASGEYAGTLQWVSGAAKYEAMILENGKEAAASLAPSSVNEQRMGWYVKPATL